MGPILQNKMVQNWFEINQKVVIIEDVPLNNNHINFWHIKWSGKSESSHFCPFQKYQNFL